MIKVKENTWNEIMLNQLSAPSDLFSNVFLTSWDEPLNPPTLPASPPPHPARVLFNLHSTHIYQAPIVYLHPKGGEYNLKVTGAGIDFTQIYSSAEQGQPCPEAGWAAFSPGRRKPPGNEPPPPQKASCSLALPGACNSHISH